MIRGEDVHAPARKAMRLKRVRSAGFGMRFPYNEWPRCDTSLVSECIHVRNLVLDVFCSTEEMESLRSDHPGAL